MLGFETIAHMLGAIEGFHKSGAPEKFLMYRSPAKNRDPELLAHVLNPAGPYVYSDEPKFRV